jgi:hypothetical protein
MVDILLLAMVIASAVSLVAVSPRQARVLRRSRLPFCGKLEFIPEKRVLYGRSYRFRIRRTPLLRGV